MISDGWFLDDEPLREPTGLQVSDYFDEMLGRISAIRASERRVFWHAQEIIALAADYVQVGLENQAVLAAMGKRLRSALIGQTSPEIIATRANGALRRSDVTAQKAGSPRACDGIIADNDRQAAKIAELNRVFIILLDFAEEQARRRKPMFLSHWKTLLGESPRFDSRAVLPGAERVSREVGDRNAMGDYKTLATPRRVTLEGKGEADALRQLEAVAKQLPKRRKAPLAGGGIA